MDKVCEVIVLFVLNVCVMMYLLVDVYFDLLVECVGYDVFEEYVLLVLEQGIDCLVVLVGVLFEFGVVEWLEVVVCCGNV